MAASGTPTPISDEKKSGSKNFSSHWKKDTLFNFIELSTDIQQRIFENFKGASLPDLIALDEVFRKTKDLEFNLAIHSFFQDEYFRLIKYHFHSVHLLIKKIESKTIDYRKEFISLFSKADRSERLFIFTKEKMLTKLKKYKLKITDADKEFNITDSESYRLLDWAAKLQHQEILDYFFSLIVPLYTKIHSIDINHKDKKFYTIFHYAAACNQSHLIQALKPDDINQTVQAGNTALHIACELNHKNIVQLLLDDKRININERNIFGATPLHSAARLGHVDIVNLLLAHASININIATDIGATPLLIAVCFNHVEVVRILLTQNGIAINQATSDGITPIHIASQRGYIDVVNALLAKDGININQADNDGDTPLYTASGVGHTNVVDALLAKDGIAINQANNQGFTPLYAASGVGHTNVVVALLAKDGIAINQANNQGVTPLYMASQEDHINIVKAILAKNSTGINQGPPDSTPLLIATRKGHTEIVTCLLEVPNINIEARYQGKNAFEWAEKMDVKKIILQKRLDNFINEHSVESKSSRSDLFVTPQALINAALVLKDAIDSHSDISELYLKYPLLMCGRLGKIYQDYFELEKIVCIEYKAQVTVK